MLKRFTQQSFKIFRFPVNPAYKPIICFSTIYKGSEPAQILEEVEANVFQVLHQSSKCKREKLSRTATFEELGFDSLDGVELIIAMEEKFEVTLEDEEARKVQTVQDALSIFHKYLVERYNRDKLARIEEERALSLKKNQKKEN